MPTLTTSKLNTVAPRPLSLSSVAITNGYKINEMKDGSRVVVVRPSMSETWAFFVRKFDVKRATLEQIVLFPGKEEAIDLLKFLVKGARIVSLTGEQGCRKDNNAYGYD